MDNVSARIGHLQSLVRMPADRRQKVSQPLILYEVAKVVRTASERESTANGRHMFLEPPRAAAAGRGRQTASESGAAKQPVAAEVQAAPRHPSSFRIANRTFPIPVIRKEENPMTLFRIVPDRRISNNQNRKFWRLIHELMELDHRLRNRVSHEGWNFRYHARDTVWFDMVARCEEVEVTDEEGKKRTEQLRKLDFYMAVPTKFASAFKQKLIDRNAQITIEEVPFSEVTVPAESEITEYRFKRHDIFSMDAKDNEQQTPISSLMNAVLDLQGNDFMRFSVCLERMDRKRWRSLADYAWKQLDKKRVPARARFDLGLLLRNIGDIGRYVALELKSVIEETLQGIQSVFFRSENKITSGRKKVINDEYERLFANGDLAPESKKKLFDVPYKAKVRLAVHSPDRARVHMIKQGITNALHEMNGDNQLQAHKVRVNIRGKHLEEMNTFQTRIKDRDPNVMSAKEIGKLNQYPTAELQERFADILESKRKIEVDIPKCFRDKSGIFVGVAEVRGEIIPIYLPAKNMDKTMTARGFIGSPRQGKDQALINLIVESKRKHGIGAVIPDWIDERNKDKDGHWRGISNAVRDSLPPEDVIDIDCTDYEWAVYLGLSNIMKTFTNARIAADEVSKIITDFLMGSDKGDLHTTREHLRDAAKVCVGDWVDIKRLFTDADFREQKIAEMEHTNIGDADLWKAFHEDLSESQRSNIFTPVNVRLAQIMNDEVLKPIMCQRPNQEADFAKWIEEGKVVIVRMKFNPQTAKIFAHYLIMMVYLIKRRLDGRGAPTWLAINEPHQIETPEFTEFLNRILVEGPKLKLAPVVAFHHLGKGHLSRELIDTLSSANISWHMFYNSNLQTYEKLEAHIEPTFTPEEAMRTTAQFHFIAAGWRDNHGTVQPPFMVKAPDRVKDRWGDQDNSFLTKRHSRQFGRQIDEVLADFRERNKRLRKVAVPNEQLPTDDAASEPAEPAKPKRQPPKHVFAKK